MLGVALLVTVPRQAATETSAGAPSATPFIAIGAGGRRPRPATQVAPIARTFPLVGPAPSRAIA